MVARRPLHRRHRGKRRAMRGDIVVVDVATGSERVLPTPDWRQVSRVAWLPDGSGILVTLRNPPRNHRVRSFSSLSVGLGPADHERSEHLFWPERGARRPVVRLHPQRAARDDLDDAAGRRPRRRPRSRWTPGADDGIHGMAWTPDGRIVYTTEASGNPDVWIMASDGSRRVQLTSTHGQDVSPRVTPDGKYIVFVSDRDGGHASVADGSRRQRRDPPSEDIVARARGSLSSDGKWIYYSDAAGEPRKVSIDGGASVAVFSADGGSRSLPPGFHEPMPSPDGATVAGHYTDQAARGERIALVSDRGGLRSCCRPFPRARRGRRTAGPSSTSIRAAASRTSCNTPIAGGAATPLTKFTSEQIFSYAISPDQRQVAWCAVASTRTSCSSRRPGSS